MSEDSEVDIILASGREIEAIQSLWREYWDSLGPPLDFQSFAEELRILPAVYAPSEGRLLLALIRRKAAGTAAFRPLNTHSREAKRLYVRSQYRGKGIGRSLLYRLAEEARVPAPFRRASCLVRVPGRMQLGAAGQ